LSGLAMLKEAAACGVRLTLNGDNLALKASAKPAAALLAKLKAHKAEIVALLRQASCAVHPAGYSDAEWLATIADAKRLGYPPREDG
jgi:TubC N-terminal docking domain